MYLIAVSFHASTTDAKRILQDFYLLAALCVQYNPAEFYTFCRVLGDVDTVFITCRSNVNHHIALKLGLAGLGSAHSTGRSSRFRYEDCSLKPSGAA